MVMPLTETSLGEVWMQVRDHRKLARLVLIQGVTQRQLAEALGHKSHTYIGRVLMGEKKTMTTEAAIRLCHFLQVPVDDFFMTKSSKNPRQVVRKNAA